ncbi:HAD family hydrolase [Pseudodesulfovibrio piezophilus]|uniref:HAD-superfamily hydrolase, subfamily IA, variant 3 n=1 Tax=Pseudodesulfovibrio piezophilus (strain DSM 21447 / JCM 15486 / C1TLV30) TaxID=1322246 RepID=M1WKU6_PSEP2|nr:HAD family phosphatase [Pseudodesulfovibrio piezophilus]CCH50211.1 HAD-superfamily hydrolase, subfamily IA, variant 3 [Pseudodesulfovibrio piezophilus C1TLV30]
MTQKLVDAIFWDIDGTLILTEELHFQSVADYCTKREMELTDADNAAMIGKTMIEKWDYLHTQKNLPGSETLFRHECAQYYMENLKNCRIRESPLRLMRKASDMNIPQACVSNGDRQVVHNNINVLGIGSFIDFALTGDDFDNGKPAPDPYRLACKKMGIPHSRGLVVEDSRVGVASAAAAGLTVIAWPDASSSFTSEDFAKADYLISSLEEFPAHLLGLTQADMASLTK